MKTIPILMPQMGQSVAEGTIVRWRKKVGDAVAADEVLMEVESDKITVEVESPAAGRLASCLKGEGARAAIGEVVAMLETEAGAAGAAEPAEPPRETRANRPHAGADTDQTLVSAITDDAQIGMQGRLPELTRDWLSPFVLRLAVMNNVSLQELQAIRGSGRQGRITKTDLLQYLARRPVGATSLAAETDSGLAIDAIRIVAQGVNSMRNPDRGFLVITHYQRLLDYIVPDRIHVMQEGAIVRSGDKSLALELEKEGYAPAEVFA